MNTVSASKSDLSDRKRKIAYVAMFLVAFLWGLSWPIGRTIATAELGPVPFTSAFIRFGLAIPILLIAVKVIEKPKSIKLPKSMIKPVILLGIMQVSLHNFLLLTSLRYTSGSDGVLIINGGITVFTVLLTPLVYSDEKITANKLIGMIVAISE
ncbi:MAG: DMT family transporter [Candidatus Heimdallarchaeota archaeon]|nr:DMT family transporter [Candidatus Heimdallarchaeota archaeon]